MVERRDLERRYVGSTDLVDLLDRIVDRGAVVTGDVVIGLAGVDLILLDLKLLLISVEGLERERMAARAHAGHTARRRTALDDLFGPDGEGR